MKSLIAISLSLSFAAQAADFPTKPARIVVPIGAGSSMDIVGRVLAQKLTEAWGQSVIVDNRAGAGGNIGADLVAKSAPDGYTILFASSSFSIAPAYYRKLPYNALRDFVAVTQLSSRNNVTTVSPSSGVSSVKELIALAKAKPGQLTFGSGGGSGSSDQMAGELFKLLAGVDIVHVPYKSGPQAMNDLIGGQMSVYFGGIPVQLPMIKAGKVKPLGTSGLKRSSQLPDVPTMMEAGVPGYEMDVWYGLFAPAGTPKAIVDKIAAESIRIMQAPDMRERWASVGVEPAGTASAEFSARFKEEIGKWAKVVNSAKLAPD
ncbi:MAG: putative exported protein [Betaproteobacteria bacterium]|nr:putative exported protein [Betaproteobacteria bacterium]